MKDNFKTRSSQAFMTSVIMLSSVILATAAQAQNNLTEHDFLEALTKPAQAETAPPAGVRTRGLNFDDRSANVRPSNSDTVSKSLSSEQKSFLDNLANRKTTSRKRGVSFSDRSEKRKKTHSKTSSVERKKLRKMVQENNLPSIDVEINFEYNSARLQTKSKVLLNNLGKALLHERLKRTRIMLSGHTDAKGSESYNLSLSQQRADAVKAYLVRRIGIQARRLIAVGNGEEQLKDSYNPHSGKNRRVQIVNLAG